MNHHLKIAPEYVVFVRVCSFTFEFLSADQVKMYLEYYQQVVRPSSRLPVYTGNFGGDHGEAQRWFERLPMYLLEKPKRRKVIKALTLAFEQF